MHIIGISFILLIEECATLLLVLYIIYTGQPSFSLVHFIFSCSNLRIWPLYLKFYLVCKLDIPLQCLVYLIFSFYFILSHLAKILLIHLKKGDIIRSCKIM